MEKDKLSIDDANADVHSERQELHSFSFFLSDWRKIFTGIANSRVRSFWAVALLALCLSHSGNSSIAHAHDGDQPGKGSDSKSDPQKKPTAQISKSSSKPSAVQEQGKTPDETTKSGSSQSNLAESSSSSSGTTAKTTASTTEQSEKEKHTDLSQTEPQSKLEPGSEQESEQESVSASPTQAKKSNFKKPVSKSERLELLAKHEASQHYNLARKYMADWENELAELELRMAIMKMPDLRIAHRDFCVVAMMRGKPMRALAEFLMVVGIGEPIPLDEKQKSELVAETAKAHYNKALEWAGKDDWDKAITEFLWAKHYQPTDARIDYSIAFAYARKGDYDKAIKYYESTLTLDPDDPDAHADFAFLLSDRGRAEQALVQMREAVKLNPEAVALRVDLGWLSELSGDYSSAASEFGRAVELSPEYPLLWYRLASNLSRLDKKNDAREALEKAIALDPHFESAKKALSDLKD